MSGAECSVGRNPLAQFTKHVGEDRSLQRDRLAGPPGGIGSSAPGAGMRTEHIRPLTEADRELMSRFEAMNLDHVLRDSPAHRELGRQAMQIARETGSLQPVGPAGLHNSMSRPASSPMVNGNWANEFGQPQGSQWSSEYRQQQVPGGDWTREFSAPATTSGAPAPMMSYNSGPQWYGMGDSMSRPMGGLYNPGLTNFNTMPMTMNPLNNVQQRDKGKGKIVELDSATWEQQFELLETQDASTSEVKEEAEAPAESDSKEHEKIWRDAYSGETIDETYEGDFENIWRGIQEQHLQDGTASQIGHQNNLDPTVENLFGNDRFLDASEIDNPYSVRDEASELKMPWDKDFEEFAAARSDSGDYQYENDNHFMQEDVSDPFQEGVRILESGGNLSEAALAFEAAVRKDPQHVQAWSLLGAVQSQNEKEDPAIRALERAVQLDESNESALMNLAVAYINEGYENAAYATLEKWIATKYPDIVNQARDQTPQLANADIFRLHERVTELFIRAAQLSPEGMSMDADVQVGLGVLFYGSEEYDKAVDCFNAALSVRPDDPLLWNRLGATLANSRRSEEAIEAYYKALEIRPSFVRARYNLGASCINIGCYKEAAQHFLTALEMHRVPGGHSGASEEEILANESTTLYDTLRRVFLAMDRRDLADKVVTGVDPAIFKDAF
ncbi:peroxisomal targeting signal receptor [Myxozyma melibiosi]|uniref:Peroxisomal targeting signal receptor n=1 Tax=Myxozyma melibiosi TaxID=54550 RepID=A0ABR1FDL1_9ASCO